MRKIALLLLVILILPRNGVCDHPPAFNELHQKFLTIEQLRFTYSERHTPTGVGFGSLSVPLVRTYEANISATRDELYLTYNKTQTGQEEADSGTFISDGKYTWHYSKRGGKNNPTFVSKQPVGYQEEVVKQITAAIPGLNQVIHNCLPFSGLFDPNKGSIWNPFKLYDVLKGHPITTDVADVSKMGGIHHWTVEPEPGCGRVELWINDEDGTLVKFTTYNPHKGFENQVEHVGEFSNIEMNVSFPPDFFTFDPKMFPDAQVLSPAAKQSVDMVVNTMAAPANLVFESIFSVAASAVSELEGTGSTWMTYTYHLRFSANTLPTLIKPYKFSLSTPDKSLEFFKKMFPKDVKILEDVSALEMNVGQDGKNRIEILRHTKKNLFFVRAWGGE